MPFEKKRNRGETKPKYKRQGKNIGKTLKMARKAKRNEEKVGILLKEHLGSHDAVSQPTYLKKVLTYINALIVEYISVTNSQGI